LPYKYQRSKSYRLTIALLYSISSDHHIGIFIKMQKQEIKIPITCLWSICILYIHLLSISPYMCAKILGITSPSLNDKASLRYLAKCVTWKCKLQGESESCELKCKVKVWAASWHCALKVLVVSWMCQLHKTQTISEHDVIMY